jgi:hypothetical protein
MAGDFTPMDHDLPDKEEMLAIIESTGDSIETVFYRIFLLWRLFDRQTIDGIMHGCGARSIASQLGGKPAFWESVANVGWLSFKDGNAELPGFTKRFKISAKARREAAVKRKQEYRERKKTQKNVGQSMGQRVDELRDTHETNASPVSVSVSVSSFTDVKETPRDQLSDFETWWKVYPKKSGKDAACRAYAAAIKRIRASGQEPKQAHQTLFEAVTRYAASPKASGDYCWNPATWLNGGHWDDDPSVWNQGGSESNNFASGPGQKYDPNAPKKPVKEGF